jgi:hypothetical protein
MSQKLNVSVLGLSTNTNYQTLPDGSLVACKNVNIDRKLAFPRRGFSKHSTLANIDALTEYQNKIIAHTSNNYLQYYSAGWNTLSTSQTAPTGYNMKFLGAAQNLYMTTSSGVKMLDVYNGTVYSTGMPRGLDGVGSTTGGTGFMATNTQVAYRVVWGSRDVNSNLYLGAPSQRIIVANTSGGLRDVSLTLTIPSGISTSDFFQVYRSRASASSTTEPDDELQLIYEENPTGGEIAALSLTFTDNTPDSLKGAFLYSNENQEGAAETNDIPPYCIDIAEFKNFTFFAGIKTKYYLDLTLLATGGTTGLVANDTITINGMVFTAKAATTIASREFKVFTAGSAGQNVDDTARELVKVINQYTSNTTIYAYYESGYADLPGKILLEERTMSGSAFTVSISRATAWTLDNSGTAVNSQYQNGIMWSKENQPEHVPSAHLRQIGSKSYAIKRILALKDSLFILKEDGVFRLTGDNGSWSIDVLDSSTFLIAPESADVMNNQIYALTNQGVAAISDVGVQVVSEDIKDSLQALIGQDYASLQTTTYGIGYETDRKYILGTIVTGGTVEQQWVLNVFTNKWSRWEKSASCGFVAKSVDKLYLANSTSLLEERKSFSFRDYIDEDFGTFNVVSSTGTSVVLDTVADLSVGDLLYQSSSMYSPITAINAATNTVTVNDTQSWAASAVTVYKALDCSVEWAPAYCDNSGYEKAFHELQMMFKKDQILNGTIGFYTDLNGGYDDVTVSGNFGGAAWGLFGWGSVAWGGELRPKPIRVSVPRNKSRGSLLGVRFAIRMAYAEFVVDGYSLIYDYVSERQGGRGV